MGLFDFFRKNMNKNTPTSLDSSNSSNTTNTLWHEDDDYKSVYAKTIFLYYCKKTKPIREEDGYPRYFSYDFNIENCTQYHKELIIEGYLQEASINDVLNTLKITELKDFLGLHNLPKTGKKSELVKRILNSISESELNDLTNSYSLYSLSNKGIDFLEKHTEYVQLFKNSSYLINIDEYEKTKKKLGKNFSFNDVVWHILNQRLLDYEVQKQYGLLRNTYFEMGVLVEKEARNKQALSYYIITLLYDVSGLNNLNLIINYLNGLFTKKDLKDLYIRPVFAPGLIEKIVEYKSYYENNIATDIYQKHLLDINLCSHKSFEDLVQEIIDDSFEEEKWLKYFDKNYNSLIKDLKRK